MKDIIQKLNDLNLDNEFNNIEDLASDIMDIFNLDNANDFTIERVSTLDLYNENWYWILTYNNIEYTLYNDNGWKYKSLSK